MTFKTYSRARAALAAFNGKVTGLPESATVETFEPTTGRYAVRVTFSAAPSDELREQIEAFGAEIIVEIDEDEAAMAADAALDGAMNEEAKATAKKKSGYIRGRSVIESPVAHLHLLADEMFNDNPKVRRKDIIEAAQKIGITYGTARTQLQKWYENRRG